MEYIFLGFDSLVVSALYYIYKKKTKTLLNIKNATEINLSDNKMVDNEVIDYGMIVGLVSPDNIELTSNYDKAIKGVIRVVEVREHGTKFNNNTSLDTNRLVSRVINDVPFSLVNSNVRVQVDDPLTANYLLEYLDLTHTNFEQTKDSLIKKILAGIFTNESVKGIQTTESMLKKGTRLTAFGRIEKLPNIASTSWLNQNNMANYRITESSLKDYEFIITPLSRKALIEKLIKSTKSLKIFLYLFTSVGVVVGSYCAYKVIKEYLDKRKRERQLEQARQERLKNQRARAQHYDDENILQNQNNDDRQDSATATCVICLVNPRELVLLDCGHVCLCMDCFERMPNSNCPICRQRFRTFVPCYIP
ncbi:unnamed protein product [Brachionus calyciflorus]|uniref:RING-type E3 ubiquitin transferase n=1 Tax=Brachionus calyciflorus TaxID=104777 RepID=A0A814CGQ1_9BILA|nr:unnamed protein product [Brachionus calyciflorus]